MYIFILFVVFWNVNATSHVLSIPKIDFEDEVSLPLAIGAPVRVLREQGAAWVYLVFSEQNSQPSPEVRSPTK